MTNFEEENKEYDKTELEKIISENLLLQKIIRDKGIDIANILSCKGKQLETLFLLTHYLYAKKLTPLDIKKQYLENRFTSPSAISQKEFIRLESMVYDVIPDAYKSIELSPVNPIGTNSVLTKINQKTVLSTVRNTEVLADATTAMALETVKLREESYKIGEKEKIFRLCTFHRFLRTQLFDERLRFLSHFKIFSLCTAGRSLGNNKLEYDILLENISIYLNILNVFKKEGYIFQKIIVNLSDIRMTEQLIKDFSIKRSDLLGNTTNPDFNRFEKYAIAPKSVYHDLPDESLFDTISEEFRQQLKGLKELNDHVLSVLKEKYPNIEFNFDIGRFAGMGYYDGYCAKILVEDTNGNIFPIVDAGFSNWNKEMMKNNKELFFGGGFGFEFFIKNFGKEQDK